MKRVSAPMAAIALICAVPMAARAQEEPAADLLHADLPLFGDETKDKWPRAFTDVGSGDFGCTSRVRFGDWSFRETEYPDDESWFQFSNYGAFHCSANIAEASERASLEAASSRPGFFVLLDGRHDPELWALQIGARPGSDYILLSRPAGEGIVTSFSVLQRDCPAGSRRNGRPIDILTTGYCSIPSLDELLQLARSMAKRAPLGTLTLAEPIA